MPRNNFMQFISLILLLGTLSANAQVIKNKGPIFQIKKTNQQELLKIYMAFRAKNYLLDETKSKALDLLYLKESVFNKNFSLPTRPKLEIKPQMLVIDNNISSSYKDAVTGKYIDNSFLKITYGLCMGYTVALRQFHYFAKFDPAQPIDSNPKVYQKLIDRIFANRTATIPGFSNLSELSTSIHGDYIQRHIADQWALKNVNLKGAIRWAVPLPRITKKSVAGLKKRIDSYLNRNFEPIVIFYDSKGFSSYAHVVRAIDTTPIDDNGCFNLKTLDVDGSIDKDEICPGIFRSVDIAPNEKNEFMDYYLNLIN